MTILIGLGAAAVLLYYWLLAHWFARVLMFLALVVLLGFGGGVMFSAIAVNRLATAPFVVGAILGALLAWPLASIPIWRKRNIYVRGRLMLNPKADPAELRRYAKEVYGRI